jgi:lipoyl(octanoyl) transferase
MDIAFTDWGFIDYESAWKLQQKLFDERVMAKMDSKPTAKPLNDVAVFCEHPPVFTLGKSGDLENLLINNEQLKEKGVTFYRTDRGGDITYHGPGQLVLYPIFDLEHYNIGLKKYIHLLEETVIRFLAEYGVVGERLEGSIGVWIDTQFPGKTRKICAIGVRSSRYVTMHGLALNINTDLSFYNYINPCGYIDKGVTSLKHETSRNHRITECQAVLYKHLIQVFHESVGK